MAIEHFSNAHGLACPWPLLCCPIHYDMDLLHGCCDPGVLSLSLLKGYSIHFTIRTPYFMTWMDIKIMPNDWLKSEQGQWFNGKYRNAFHSSFLDNLGQLSLMMQRLFLLCTLTKDDIVGLSLQIVQVEWIGSATGVGENVKVISKTAVYPNIATCCHESQKACHMTHHK